MSYFESDLPNQRAGFHPRRLAYHEKCTTYLGMRTYLVMFPVNLSIGKDDEAAGNPAYPPLIITSCVTTVHGLQAHSVGVKGVSITRLSLELSLSSPRIHISALIQTKISVSFSHSGQIQSNDTEPSLNSAWGPCPVRRSRATRSFPFGNLVLTQKELSWIQFWISTNNESKPQQICYYFSLQ